MLLPTLLTPDPRKPTLEKQKRMRSTQREAHKEKHTKKTKDFEMPGRLMLWYCG
jgi:hypothetical protein